ncbi:MAG TPA: hypothetical protein VMH90_01085, partial [Thermoplasmata archaeon]|nr:hypothetical protein [Thermoplasmata archaeon]
MAPTPGWSPPPPAPAAPRKTLIIVGVVVVVVIILLLAGLYAAGVGPFSKSGSGSSTGGGADTFSQAASAASPAATGVAGGPWTVIGGSGVLTASSFSVNSTFFETEAAASGCDGKLLTGSSTISSLPSSTEAPVNGATPIWVIYFDNSTGGVLEVAVIGGTATPVVTFVSFGPCGESPTLNLPTNHIDSPAAAAAALSDGGTTYSAAHSSFSTIFVLVPGTSATYSGHTVTVPASWEVELTNCNPSQTTATTLDG